MRLCRLRAEGRRQRVEVSLLLTIESFRQGAPPRGASESAADRAHARTTS
jgi:hypothetical protein